MQRILFVCTGNTCRSAMAAALLQQMLQEQKQELPEIVSAGIAAIPGDRASAGAIAALQAEGIDLQTHRAQPVDEALVETADLILTMTGRHKAYLLQNYPAAQGKVFTLKEFVGETGDITDPWGQDVAVYKACALDLKRLLAKVLAKLKAQAADHGSVKMKAEAGEKNS